MTWVNVGDRHAAPSPRSPTAYVPMKECNCILAGPFSMCIRLAIELVWEDEGWWEGPRGSSQGWGGVVWGAVETE